MTPAETTPTDLPDECGHKDWQLGCPRCFYEMKGLALDKVGVSQIEAKVEGAILFNWHVLLMLKDVEVQLLPYTRSMDLKDNEVARSMIQQIKNIGVYLVEVVQRPDVLQKVLDQAAEIAKEMQRVGRTADTAGQEPPKSGLIITG